MKKTFKKVASVAIIAVATIVISVTFQSCNQEVDSMSSSEPQNVFPLTEAKLNSINRFYNEIYTFSSSLSSVVAKINRRSGMEYPTNEMINNEYEEIILESIESMDKCAIDMLISFGFSTQEISDLQMDEVPLVATITANELVSSLETIEDICPETPITEGPDGVWVTQKQFKEMSIDCLAEMLDLDPKTIIGIITVDLATKKGLFSAVSQIAKNAKANVVKYLSAGYLSICVLYIDWGLCMKGKLDSL